MVTRDALLKRLRDGDLIRVLAEADCGLIDPALLDDVLAEHLRPPWWVVLLGLDR